MNLMRRPALAGIVALATAAQTPACSSCDKERPGAPSSGALADASAPVLPAVAAPEGLLARVWVRAPDALWARVQSGVSGVAALLPSSVGSLLCGAAGLEAELGPLVDGKAVSYVVVAGPAAGQGAGGGGGELAWAVAVPLRDAPRAASVLLPAPSEASPARYATREGAGGRVLARADRPLPFAVALAGGFLLLARDEACLERLAPYAWRTMPTLPAPAAHGSVVALVAHEALAARISLAWGTARAWLADRDAEERARHGGRAPDFGDPRAILEAADGVVQRRVAWLREARATTVTLEATADAIDADLSIEPGADGGAAALAAMTPGDTRPLAEVPGDAVLALLMRDGAAARADDARELSATLTRALGPRAREDDARAIGSAARAWADSRGAWLTASLSPGPPRGVTLRSAGGEAAGHALRGLVELARRPVLADPLRKDLDLGAPSITAAHVDGLAGASLATFGPRAPLGLAWGTRDGLLVAVAGEDAGGQIAAQRDIGRLGDDPRIARALSALGDDATVVLLGEPLRLDPSRAAAGAARAPAVLASGVRDGSAWLHLEVAGELLREMLRLQAGL